MKEFIGITLEQVSGIMNDHIYLFLVPYFIFHMLTVSQ